MFNRLLSHLSLRRSIAGLYYELRTLRLMAEVVLVDHFGLQLPHRQPRPKQSAEDADGIPVDTLLSEEQLAAQVAVEVDRAIAEGRDPGTSWRRDPNV